MKKLSLLVGILACCFLFSCKKDGGKLTTDTFFHVFDSDTAFYAANQIRLDDGNLLLVSADFINGQDYRTAGYMIKTDEAGNIIWKKNISDTVRILDKVVNVPGKGFAIVGCNTINYDVFKVQLYDNDGNLLQQTVHHDTTWNGYLAPEDVLVMRNGNMVIVSGENYSDLKGHLTILDPNLQEVVSKTYDAPAGYFYCTLHGLCELPDGSIAVLAKVKSDQDFFSLAYSLLLIKISPNGDEISRTFLNNDPFYETGNALINFGDKLLAVAAGQTKGQNDAVLIDYRNTTNSTGNIISGRINLVLFDTAGNFISRKTLSGYPKNGYIHSIQKTTDGGFILCGTVDQGNYTNMVSQTKIFLVKIDANLNVQWQKIFNSEYPSYGIDVVPTTDGGYMIAGHIRTFNDKYQMITIKTDANGNN